MRIKNARAFPSSFVFGKTAELRPFLAIVVKATFQLEPTGIASRLAEQQLPLFTTDEPYDPQKPGGLQRFESDLVPFKPRTDIVLVGSAHAPLGRPVRALDVALEVGKTCSRLRVFGDRYWSFGGEGTPRIVGPGEFQQLPLTYDRAFGGTDEHGRLDARRPQFRPWCESNLAGRGFCGELSVASVDRKALPNIEDPANLIADWSSQPTPVGFGFYPRNSRPRLAHCGTYDDKWRASRATEAPEDFDFRYFNGAHPSLQTPYLNGDEPVALTNVTPGGGRVAFRLPGLRPSITVRQRGSEQRPNTVLDTLVFVPDRGIYYLVWRAIAPIQEAQSLAGLEEVRIDYESAGTSRELRSGGTR